jgi:hypothetical protein
MVEYGFQMDPFLYTYIVDDILCIFRSKLRKIRLALDNPECNNGLSRRVESIIGGQCDYTNMEFARRRQQPNLILLKPQGVVPVAQSV